MLELGGIDDLASVTAVEAHVRKGTTTATLSGVVVDAVARTVEIDLGSGPSDWLPDGPAEGVWVGQIELTFVDGSEITWPSYDSTEFFEIRVMSELG